jgi:hypothetical protein
MYEITTRKSLGLLMCTDKKEKKKGSVRRDLK